MRKGRPPALSGCTYGSGSCGGMIYGFHDDAGGNIIGDYPGEELCSMVTDFGCGAYLYWSSGKWRPEENASKLGRALNNAGIQSVANPCSVGLFYAASAIGGAATSGEVYAQGGEAATTYWPQGLGWVSFWLNRGAASAATLLNLPKYYNATKGAVLGACNAMQ